MNMLTTLWETLLYQPLVNGLILSYNLLGHNLGWAIIGITVFLRILLFPLTLPGLKTSQKMREIQPELEKLKKKLGQDKQAMAQAQLKLYRKHGANPAAGCLPMIVQIIILIALFRVFNQVLSADGETITKLNSLLYSWLQLPAETVFNTKFYYLELTRPDLIPLPFSLDLGFFKLDKIPGLFLLGAAAVQFLSSKLMMPQAKEAEKAAQKTPQKKDDMASQMQKQMLFMMPAMTILIGFTFPSGLILYWFTFSLVMIVQQLLVKRNKK